MDILTVHFDADVIAEKNQAIAAALCDRSKNIRGANFEEITGEDVATLFALYDEQYFAGWLGRMIEQNSPRPMRFRVSSRMTKAGGKTTRRPIRGAFRKRRYAYEIAIATRLLFLSFADAQREVRIGGVACRSRIEALQRVMEHEIIHLIELLQWGQSSCNQPRFKKLIRNIFGHTEVRHDLVTPAEDAAVKHQVAVGSMVRFELEGRQLSGRVNRITRRATVLVESSQGQRYSDGRRYAKYYIPVEMLQPVHAVQT